MEDGVHSRVKGTGDCSLEKEAHPEKRKMMMESFDPKKFKKDMKPECNEMQSRHCSEMNQRILRLTFHLRMIIGFFWILAVGYATYEVFLAAEEHLQWQRDPVMNPGPFTELLGRGRDVTDFEWTVFTEVLFRSIVYWYGFYIILGRVVQLYIPKTFPTVSALVAFAFLSSLVGFLPTLYLFSMPVVYWITLRLQSRSAIWLVTFGYLYMMESPWHKEFVAVEEGIPEYYFAITSAWSAARCISYCFDTWDRPGRSSVSSLIVFLQYCFYFPLTINGPIILFDKYEKHIISQSSIRRSKNKLGNDVVSLLLQLLRTLTWIFIIEILLHYLYFRPLALTIPALYDINWWALCGVVYWLGQFFQLKYVVMYGIPSAIAEFDGLPAPPLPKCIAYIHRYSVLWKDFDRGLYYFLVRYTYRPTLDFLYKLDKGKRISLEFHKLIASLATFIYVYVWHNGSYEVFIWAVFNFLGITIERIGSFVKRKLDAKYNILPAVWDVGLEPIVTIPLAIMSVINSAVFCGTLATAYTVYQRFFAEFHIHYVPHFFFFFTHVGVIVRTWPIFSSKKGFQAQDPHQS